jgi:hypothetical protein
VYLHVVKTLHASTLQWPFGAVLSHSCVKF